MSVPFTVTPSFRGGILVNCYVSEELGMVVFPAKRPFCRATPNTASTSYVSYPCEDLDPASLAFPTATCAAKGGSRSENARRLVDTRPRARARSAS